jgi:hypothetical protein
MRAQVDARRLAQTLRIALYNSRAIVDAGITRGLNYDQKNAIKDSYATSPDA